MLDTKAFFRRAVFRRSRGTTDLE